MTKNLFFTDVEIQILVCNEECDQSGTVVTGKAEENNANKFRHVVKAYFALGRQNCGIKTCLLPKK